MKALLLVDIQRDFCEGGSLPVTGGKQVARRVHRLLDERALEYDLIVASRDWHTPDSDNGGHFAEWPPHCVAGTEGAEYAPELRLPEHVVEVVKGQDAPAYSAFEGHTTDGRSLAQVLDGIRFLDVVGLATDYCVKATVLDALRHGLGVTVFEDCVAAVAVPTGRGALREMASRGAKTRRLRLVA